MSSGLCGEEERKRAGREEGRLNEEESAVSAKRCRGSSRGSSPSPLVISQDASGDRRVERLWCGELEREREEKHGKWVALMMALHTRLGDQTCLAKGVVEDTWKLTCERALCLEFTLRYAAGGDAWQDYPVQTPFSSCSIQDAIEPLCHSLNVNISSCELSLDWSTLAHRKSLRWNGVQDNSLVVMTEIPETHLNLRVRNQHGTVAYFMVARSSPVRVLCEAYCARMKVAAERVDLSFHGEEIHDLDGTFSSYALEDDEVIGAWVHDVN